MSYNTKSNAVLVNTMKLAVVIRENPELAQLMKPATRERVEAAAARIEPLIRSADDETAMSKRQHAVALAEVCTRDALKLMNAAVAFQYSALPDSLMALGRLKLSKSSEENLIRLQVIARAVQGLQGFIYPPSLGPTALAAVIEEEIRAKADLAAQKASINNAAVELREMRPGAIRMWRELGLAEWIKANVVGHDARMAAGLPPRRRRKSQAAQEGGVEPFMAGTPKPAEVTGEQPVRFPSLGVNKPSPALASNGHNGTNGHDVGASL